MGRFYHLTHIRTAARMFWNLCVVYPGVFIQLLDLKLIVRILNNVIFLSKTVVLLKALNRKKHAVNGQKSSAGD